MTGDGTTTVCENGAHPQKEIGVGGGGDVEGGDGGGGGIGSGSGEEEFVAGERCHGTRSLDAAVAALTAAGTENRNGGGSLCGRGGQLRNMRRKRSFLLVN